MTRGVVDGAKVIKPALRGPLWLVRWKEAERAVGFSNGIHAVLGVND